MNNITRLREKYAETPKPHSFAGYTKWLERQIVLRRDLDKKAPHYAAIDIDHAGEPFMPGVDPVWTVIRTGDPNQRYQLKQLCRVGHFDFTLRWNIKQCLSYSTDLHLFYSTRESAEKALEAQS